MNERLREFERASGLDIYGLGARREKWEKALEKYAALVAKECMNIVETHPIDSEDMPYNMRITPYMVEVQEKMKLHFGVEE
jgi:hypothetical protein